MTNVSQIQRLSYAMQQLCVIAIVTIPLLIAWIWLNFEQFADAIARQNNLMLQLEHIGPLSLALGFLCTMIPASVIIYGLLRLRALFLLYRSNIFFTDANARHLRAFSAALFVNALLTPITGTLLSIVLTMSNPPGQRSLSLAVGSHQIVTAFIAATFMIIAAIMVEGRKLADENAEII